MRRGEIWWADLRSPIASEPGGKRPVLIIQADSYNVSAIRTVVVAALTSQVRLAEAPGNVLLPRGTAGLDKESVVNVSQILTIDKTFLGQQIGSVSAALMQTVDAGLQRILGL